MNEQALSFGPGGTLFGILSLPPDRDSRQPAVLIPNTGLDHRAGPGRMHVELARALAACGHASLRLDLPGFGDSDELPIGGGIRAPALRAAMDALDARGLASGYVVAGFGSGAEHARAAAAADPRVVGALLYDGASLRTPRYWLNRLMLRVSGAVPSGATPRVPPRIDLTPAAGDALHDMLPDEILLHAAPARELLLADFTELVRRAVPLMCVFSGQLEAEYNYDTQLLDAVPILRDYARLRLHHLPEADHRFGRRATREQVIGLVVQWLAALPEFEDRAPA